MINRRTVNTTAINTETATEPTPETIPPLPRQRRSRSLYLLVKPRQNLTLSKRSGG